MPNTYTVSLTGSNSNDGISSPWLDPWFGVSRLQPGDTLYIRGGTYTSALAHTSITSVPSGTVAAPITIAGYPGETVIFQPSTDAILLAAGGRSYLTFQDFIIDMTNASDYFGGTVGVYMSDGTHDIVFQRLEIRNVLNNGMQISSNNGSACYITVRNCHIHHCGMYQDPAVGGNPGYGIYGGTNNNLIEGCDIHDCHGYGIHFNNPTYNNNNVIRNNRVHDNFCWNIPGGVGGTSGGGIVVLSGSSPADGNLIYNNRVYHNGWNAGTSTVGIQLYNRAQNTGVYNNTVYNNNGDGVFLQYYNPIGNILRNNILFGNAGSPFHDYGDINGNFGHFTADHNITADPLFVNPGATPPNFYLQPSSPAIDAGVAVVQVPVDCVGTVRPQGLAYDVGAFEFIPSPSLTIRVHPGDNLQTAINSAVGGATIVLDDGALFTGSFSLPPHTGGTITIQGVTVPPAGVRVSPSAATNFPKIQSSGGGDPAVYTLAAANDWAIIGVELPPVPSGANDIIRLGDGSSAQNSLSQVPQRITLDRCYIHGDPSVGQKRGVALNSGDTTIVNCYISDIKWIGQDSQAIGGWNGTGPYFIDNNYLEASGENFMLGGDTTWITGNVPSNLTFTNNFVNKPLAWRTQGWEVKNLFEIKAAKHVLIDKNTFQGNWAQAQAGIPIVFTPRNQNYDPMNPGDPSNNFWNCVNDVTFTRNTVLHAGGALNISNADVRSDGSVAPTAGQNGLVARDNIFGDISDTYGGRGDVIELQGSNNVVIDHNTFINSQAGQAVSIYLIDRTSVGLILTNNFFVDNGLCVFGSSGGFGSSGLAAMAPGAVFAGNALIHCPFQGSYPAGNFFPATLADVKFTDPSTYNYQLRADSPYLASATDGGPIGARYAGASPPPPLPGQVTQPSPATGATGMAGNASLGWIAASDAVSYTVYLDTVNPPVSQAASGLTGTSYTPGSPLTLNTVYYWQVKAVNLAGSTLGPVWSFTTATPAPGTPTTPIFAVSGSTGISLTPTLTWTPGANSNSFDVLLSTANPPLTQVATGLASPSFTTATLTAGTVYFWRVRANNAAGSTLGPVWTFTTLSPPPPTPPLPGPPLNPTPANSATGISVNAILQWAGGTNAATFDVKFGTTNTPPTVSTAQAGLSYNPGTLAFNTQYWWQIVCNNSTGSTVGPLWTFTTLVSTPPPPSPPVAPATPFPVDGAVAVDIGSLLQWAVSSGAVTYDVKLDIVNPPVATVATDVVPARYQPGSPLAYGARYYWQVTAKNSGGNTAGPIWSFGTADAPPVIQLPGVQCCVGTFTTPSVGPQDGTITGIVDKDGNPFVPKAMIVWGQSAGKTNTGFNQEEFDTFGIDDGVTHLGTGIESRWFVGQAWRGAGGSESYSILSFGAIFSASILTKGFFKNFGLGTATYQLDVNLNGSFTYGFMAIGGLDIQVKVALIGMGGTNCSVVGNVLTYSGTTFKVTGMIAANHLSSGPYNDSVGQQLAIGWADTNLNQSAMCSALKEIPPGDGKAYRSLHTGVVWVTNDNNGPTATDEFQVTAWTNTGFVGTMLAGGVGGFGVLLFGNVPTIAGIIAQPLVDAPVTITAPAMTPRGILFGTVGATLAAGATITADESWCVGAYDGVRSWAYWHGALLHSTDTQNGGAQWGAAHALHIARNNNGNTSASILEQGILQGTALSDQVFSGSWTESDGVARAVMFFTFGSPFVDTGGGGDSGGGGGTPPPAYGTTQWKLERFDITRSDEEHD